MKKNSLRVESIDIFRGATILLMVFVNDLASVSGIHITLRHMPSSWDGMTIVDLVFPAFLFIVGMSLPFATEKRRNYGESDLQIFGHVLLRSFGLILLGVLMVNLGSLNPELTGISRNVWQLLLFLSVIIIWQHYTKKTLLTKLLRLTGIAVLIILMIIFRSGTETDPGWLKTKWWGILGLIGWAYITVSTIYLFAGRRVYILIPAFILLIFLFFIDEGGGFIWLGPAGRVLSIGSHIGTHSSIVLAGVIVSTILKLKREEWSSLKLITILMAFSLALALSAYLCRPFYGISKNFATPAWGLMSVSFCILFYSAVYWVVEVKGLSKWASFLRPAGMNPLLAYILPAIFYPLFDLFGIPYFSKALGAGEIGLLRSAGFSFFILYITYILTKMKIILKL